MSLKREADLKKRLWREWILSLKVKPTSNKAKISEIQLIALVPLFILEVDKGKKEKKLAKELGWKSIFKKKPINIEKVGGKKRIFFK